MIQACVVHTLPSGHLSFLLITALPGPQVNSKLRGRACGAPTRSTATFQHRICPPPGSCDPPTRERPADYLLGIQLQQQCLGDPNAHGTPEMLRSS